MKVLFVRSGNSGDDPISTNQGRSLEKEGIEIQYYDICGRGLLGYLSNIKKLHKRIMFFRPEIIHCHYSFSCILATLTFTKIPIVASLMGSDLYSFGKFKVFILRIFASFVWEETIVKSHNMYKILGVEKANIIPNGVNFSDFKIIHKKEAQKKLGWEFGQNHLVFGSDPLRSEKNFKLAEASLKRLKSSNINTEVHFLNGVDYSKVVYYFCAADVVLLTSLYEGSPNVLKEAMICNCPIVSTNVGDAKEVLNSSKGTFIVESTIESVTEGLKKAFEYTERTNGKAFMGKYDSRVIARRIVEIYENIITNKC